MTQEGGITNYQLQTENSSDATGGSQKRQMADFSLTGDVDTSPTQVYRSAKLIGLVGVED